MKIKYALGFVFNSNFSKVLLIHKNRPEWQKGKVNGIGGHVEDGETAREAILRELREEAGIEIGEWFSVLVLEEKDGIVDVFASVLTGNSGEVKSITDEKVEWFEVLSLPENCMSNLSWMVPLAKNKLTTEQKLGLVTVRYT